MAIASATPIPVPQRHAIAAARRYLAYLPSSCDEPPPAAAPRPPAKSAAGLGDAIPTEENRLFDVREVLDRLVDEDSLFQIKQLFAGEL